MDWQPVINIGIAACLASVGWIMRTIFESVNGLKDSVHDIEINVVSNYVKKDEVREVMDKIDKRFDKMEVLIGRLFDKIEAKQDKVL